MICPYCGFENCKYLQKTYPEKYAFESRETPPKQVMKLKAFIRQYSFEHGIGPTWDEMRKGIGESGNTIGMYLDILEETGHIRRLQFKQRAVEVIGP